MIDGPSRFLLQDMLDNARLALDFVGGTDTVSFSSDRRSVYAVAFAVGVVGEAASRIDAKVRAAVPTIPWRKAIDIRNRLIHGYRTLEPAILHDTVSVHFPALIAELERILNERPNDGA